VFSENKYDDDEPKTNFVDAFKRCKSPTLLAE